MKSVEKSARTVDEAIEDALRELGVTRERVEVQVLEEGNRGFFGILGSKMARVLVTLRDERREKIEAAIAFLQGLLERLPATAQIEQQENPDGTVVLNLCGENLGILIGRRGQMLDAIQYLVNVVANRKGAGDWVRIVLDASGYRQRRQEALKQLALRTAARVKQQKRRLALEPMNALERRIVHMALADDTEVETHSEGDDPYRRVVITPKRG
jgi:spoIIIJ-associated protein